MQLPEAGDLILFGQNNSSLVDFMMALVYREPTPAELSAASITEPAVVATAMSSSTPGLFATGNPATYPAQNAVIVPVSIIVATFKAHEVRRSLLTAAVPLALSPWTASPVAL
jgi:hypothetical protein